MNGINSKIKKSLLKLIFIAAFALMVSMAAVPAYKAQAADAVVAQEVAGADLSQEESGLLILVLGGGLIIIISVVITVVSSTVSSIASVVDDDEE